MDYEVKLEIFEGPLDLLLHLIHKNEVDIFDIPISLITDQYLEYIDMMKALNVDIAGDFLLMASTLIHIKSKMLLPELKDDEEEDPTLELTRPLLEYMRFKEAAESLSERDMLDRDVFSRRAQQDLEKDLKTQDPQLDVNLFQLMDAFKRVFSNDIAPLRLLRNTGLDLADRFTPLKQFFLRRALGTQGELPELALSPDWKDTL